MLIDLLGRFGVDTSLLVRRDGVQTSASVLPIRPDGSRPAFHVIGANATYTSADAPWEAIAAATHLHLGAPEFMGGEEAAKILSFAREHGVVTSADILAPGDQAAMIRDWIAPAFAHLDYLLPNDEQVLGLTGADDLQAGCRALLAARRRLRGRHPRRRRRPRGRRRRATQVPAFAVDVVDTTGCGDAFSAGFLRGLALGRSRAAAAALGCAAAGPGGGRAWSDHGDFDLAAADAFAAARRHLTTTRSTTPHDDSDRDRAPITRRRFVAGTLVTGAAAALPASAEAAKNKHKHKAKPKHKPKHHKPPSTTHTADVAVVGAGFAGLTAARQVAAAGHSVIVLEARGRVGGRAYSRSIGAGASDVANMGATFVGPTQTQILGLMAELGIGKFATYSTGKLLWYENGKGTPVHGHRSRRPAIRRR